MLEAISAYRQAAPKLLGLTRQEVRDLLRAQLALFRAQLRVWTQDRGALVNGGSHAGIDGGADPQGTLRARALARAVTRTAKYGVFRPSCLVRSIALCRLMERHGIAGGTVQVGVILRNGKFTAHAWVRLGEEVLGDDADAVARYEQLTDVSVRHAD